MRSLHLLLALSIPIVQSSWTRAADPAKPQVFNVGRLHPASSPPIDKAVLVVQDGKIIAVGKQGETPTPADAVIHNLPEAVIIPGLVDSHSHIGLWSRPGVPGN
ncbi:MAG: amidohydrolase, partial [Planctomycetes bacterium]|nr:amidohydrolase [Planctomycetota bacterium]